MSQYKDFARFYDKLTENVDYRKIAWYVDLLVHIFGNNGNKKGILLDLACGTGSLARRFATLKYDVIGIDLSKEMLSVAVSKPQNNIIYLCQDMANLDLYGTVDVTVCALDSINHLASLSAIEDTFNGISLFTNPGGLFIFDINTVYKHRQILRNNTFVYDLKDLYCVWQNELHKERVDISLDFFEDNGGTITRYHDEFSERAYPIFIVQQLLKKAGFVLEACFKYLTLKSGSEHDEKVTIVARKRK